MFNKIVQQNQEKLFKEVMKKWAKSLGVFNKRTAKLLRKRQYLTVPTFYDEFTFVIKGGIPDELESRFEEHGFTCDVNFNEDVRGTTTISRKYYSSN